MGLRPLAPFPIILRFVGARMPAAVRTELTLPGDAGMLRLVQDQVRGLAELAGLPEDQGESMAQAVWEACRNSIQHAFEED